jgi:hypothetical protein
LVVEPTHLSCTPSVARTPLGTHVKPATVQSSGGSAFAVRALRLERDELTAFPSASAAHRGDLSPWPASAGFDDNDRTYWQPDPSAAPGPQWLVLDFGEATALTGIDILPLAGIADPEIWSGTRIVVQGSDDGLIDGSWTDRERFGEDTARLEGSDRQWIRLRLRDGRPYRYYRLLSPEPADLSLREMRFETADSDRRDHETLPVEALVREGLLTSVPSAVGGLTVLRPTRRELSIMKVVEVPDDSALELPPGTVIRFGPEAGILSYGPVRALGREDAPVRLLPASPALGYRGIAIVKAKAPSILEHVELAGARGGFFGLHQISGGLSVYHSSVRIRRSHLHDLPANDGVHLSHAAFEIEDSRFEGAPSDVLDIDWGFGMITGSSFDRCGLESGDCLDVSGSRIGLRDIRIDRASDKGVSIGEASVVEIETLQVSNSRIGVAVKDGAVVRIENCILLQNEYGLLRYIKKPFYSYPALTVEGCRYSDNAVARLDEPAFIWTRRYD